jgi:hypothetical protein
MVEYYEQEAEMNNLPEVYGGGFMPQRQDNDVFQRANDLRVIQEYNSENLIPEGIKTDFWAIASKSTLLSFWEKADEAVIYNYFNTIKTGHIMTLPKYKYTFKERQQINQVGYLLYSNFKRGVGMEKYKINERTLQAVSISQNINSSASNAKQGGILSMFKSIFA